MSTKENEKKSQKLEKQLQEKWESGSTEEDYWMISLLGSRELKAWRERKWYKGKNHFIMISR